MLRGKLSGYQRDWDTQLQRCMMGYRSSVHEYTGETPNLLMLGRQVKVPKKCHVVVIISFPFLTGWILTYLFI